MCVPPMRNTLGQGMNVFKLQCGVCAEPFFRMYDNIGTNPALGEVDHTIIHTVFHYVLIFLEYQYTVV